MSKISLSPSPTGSAVYTIASPAGSTDRTLTLPDGSGALYNQSNIVGTVSESGGVPTGAIIERGSNANGEFVKYADGTMICWNDAAGAVSVETAVGNVFRSTSDATWTFPSSFFVSPVCSGQATVSTSRWLMLGEPTTTSVTFRQVGPNTSATGIQSRLNATGRWY